ncbi:hypothetical protein RVR_4407 [Actinacidiphila reveromycinica]|uniref:Uncharacterized protein n=1 Tax=Actinacidiphila reveromycinica TaxID=659352 RepID=A0A7U3UT52_9ACTN|nr:hypothetical protein [Streptomyces sp. SN-593]BBA98276.1 hypothetical protein RVR_4407 [Streptomyces sp. SN-593]
MTWLDAFVLYIETVDAVVSTAPVWVPLLLGLAALGVGIRRVPRRRHRRTRHPDASGQDPDSPPDIPALLSPPDP